MNCRVPECPNPADMYSKTGLCEKHQKKYIRYQQISFMFRVWAFIHGFVLVAILIEAIAGLSSPLTNYFFVAWETMMFLIGLLVFIHYWWKTWDVRL